MNNSVYLILLVFNFFQTLNVSVLPYYLLNVSSNPSVYSTAISLYSLGMFVGSLLIGLFGDRINKSFLAICLIPIYAIIQLTMPYIHDVPLLYFVRTLSGFVLSGVVSNAIPLILEYSPNPSVTVGKYTAYSSVLISFGTLSGGILSNYISFEFPLYVQLILSLLISFSLLSETRTRFDSTEDFAKDTVSVISKNIENYPKKNFLSLIAINALYSIAFFYVLQGSRYVFISEFHINPATNGYISAYTGILGLVIGRYVYPKLNNWVNTNQIFIFGLILFSLGLLLIGLSYQFLNIVLFLSLSIATQNLVKIPLNVTLSKESRKSQSDRWFGINNAAISLSSSLGTFLVGPGMSTFGQISFTLVIILIFLIFVIAFNINTVTGAI